MYSECGILVIITFSLRNEKRYSETDRPSWFASTPLRCSLRCSCYDSDIMAYFAGAPDGDQGAHDEEARLIAEQGRKFATTRFRWEDMQSYIILLGLEVCSRHFPLSVPSHSYAAAIVKH